MRKILAIILASLMLLTLVACNNGGTEVESNKNDTTTDNKVEHTTEGKPEEDVKLPAIMAPNTELTYDDPTTTLGYYFWQKFVEVKTENASATSAQIVEAIFNSNLVGAIQMPMAYEITPDMPLSGFYYENEAGEEIKIEGYTTGQLFGSGMMGVAFIGFVFDLEEGTDVNAFMAHLDENKDTRWNCCTTADMTIIDAIGNTVFMVMCPIPAPYSVSGIPEIKAPATAPAAGSLEEKVWNKYVEILTENYDRSAKEVCDLIASGLGLEAEVVEYTENGIPADNFQYEIYDYMSAASVTDGSKVVYVINNYDGLDMMGWADYYLVMCGKYETVFGSYNSSIVAIVDTSAPLAQ